MITCEEFVSQGPKAPRRVWLHGLDLLNHILKKDTNQTIYGCPEVEAPKHFAGLQKAIKNTPPDPEPLEEDLATAFAEVGKKWITEKSDTGDLDVDRFLAGDEYPMDDYRRTRKPKPAITVIFDSTVPYMDREGTYIKKRHRKVYAIAAKAMAERRPCRVIALRKVKFPKEGVHETIIVIKDYMDPIFPGIWGALQDNRSANDLANCIADYLYGADAGIGNGHPRPFNIDNEFDGLEVIHVK